MTCYAKVTDQGKAAALVAESEERWENWNRITPIDTTAPALQCLALPSKSGLQLPKYDSQPSYLSPLHCRLCLQEVPDLPPCDAAVGATLRRGNQDNEAKVPVHPAVAKHILEKHPDYTLQRYRSEMLRQAVASWPEGVSPQVLRTRLAAYKEHLREDYWKPGICACCARHKRIARLQSVEFFSASADKPPSWLGWSDLEWARYREEWCQNVSRMFSIESYLQNYFDADVRVRQAEQELVDVQASGGLQYGFRSVLEAKRWRDRVRVWRDNTRRALEEDSVQGPGDASDRWLLYVPSLLGLSQDAPVVSVACHFCRKCAAALRKRDSKGVPRPEMPYLARARGMWGGPEPFVIRVLSFTERRVIQLARVYTVLKRVLRKHAAWAGGNTAALPQYTTQNTVAFPNDPSCVTRTVCLLPEDLCKDMAVQFVSTMTDAFQEPALQVSVVRLRAALAWLLCNCWPWMVQTKYLGVVDAQNLGEYFEHLLDLYRTSVGPSGEGVPREFVYAATQIDEAHIPQGRPGPAEAAAADGNDTTNPNVPGHTASSTPPKAMDFSSAVLDTGLEDLGPLAIWNAALKKYRVLEECNATLQSLQEGEDQSIREQALRDETLAISEAARALQRLAGDEVRHKLRAFVEDERDDTTGPSQHGASAADGRVPTRTAREELQTFWDKTQAGNLILKLRHKPELLNSFDDLFWAHCFVDLFFRGDCREKYMQHSPQLSGRRWIRLLLQRADFHG